jgi:hypothetical protein
MDVMKQRLEQAKGEDGQQAHVQSLEHGDKVFAVMCP